MNQKLPPKRVVEVCFDDRTKTERIETLFKFKQFLTMSSIEMKHRQNEHRGSIQIWLQGENSKAVKKKAFGLHDTNRPQEMGSCVVSILFLDLGLFKDIGGQTDLECCILHVLKPGIKNILVMEEVREYLIANEEPHFKSDLDRFLLEIQMQYGMDHILSSTRDESVMKLSLIVEAILQPPKTNQEFKEKKLLTDRALMMGVKKYHQQLWGSIISQVHGMSEEKALTLVKMFPTFKGFMQAMMKFNSETYQLMLARGFSKSLIQQLYCLMTSFNEDRQLYLN